MNQNHIMIPVMDSFGLKNFIFDHEGYFRNKNRVEIRGYFSIEDSVLKLLLSVSIGLFSEK